MAYSNLQSFHRGLVLQNATAFPTEYYVELHNASSVRPISRYLSLPILSIHDTRPRLTAQAELKELDSLDSLYHTPPEKQVSSPVSPELIPTVLDVLRPSITIETVPILEKGGRTIWQPGHGLIEKVDKLTGEIVHLTEKYPPATKI
ncbi:hypothetical protein [Thiothrix eikelboomii]|uniref:hypothetical protein n=1 Tax=Thiothrix eikelboomii TaxID=92487 RepID=UPI003BB098D0